MNGKKPDESKKEGVSVQELENLGKKYRFEIFFVAYFVLASLFTFALFSPQWSIYLAALGGVMGVLLPKKVESVLQGMFRFIYKQEKITQLILGGVGVIVSIFLPFVVFFAIGLSGGQACWSHATKTRT